MMESGQLSQVEESNHLGHHKAQEWEGTVETDLIPRHLELSIMEALLATQLLAKLHNLAHRCQDTTQ